MESESRHGGGIARALQRRLSRAVELYVQYLQERPVLTKAATAGLLAGVGDLTSQWLVCRGRTCSTPVQWRSVASVTLFGSVVSMHYLYQALEALSPRSSSLSALRKVVLDRLIFTPPYLLAFFYIVALLEGQSPSEAWVRVRAIFWSALLWNWAMWGPAQYINMSYIPLKYRVLFSNVVAFIWNIYTALLRRH